MTIEKEYAPQDSLADGTTTTFVLSWPFADPKDITVTLYYSVSGSIYSPAPVLNGTATYDYQISGTKADTGLYSAGAVTFRNAPPSGLSVIRSRSTTIEQGSLLKLNGRFPAKVLEAMSDRLTMIAQENAKGAAELHGRFELSGGICGRRPCVSETIFDYTSSAKKRFLAGLPGSVVRCTAVPESDWEFTLTLDDDEVGAATIPAGKLVGSWTAASDIVMQPGSSLKWVSPALVDNTGEGISGTLIGNRVLGG